ncbi:MAG: hypothetical protein KY457_01190 [Actinobacteria bacterium]|nr:hypothetical protein [Actinomycetota bacterium]
MGFVQKKGGDEGGSGGSGLEMDLDLQACAVCRRELLPWQDTCPEDGGTAVPKAGLPAVEDPVAARLAALLDEPEPAGGPADEPGERA